MTTCVLDTARGYLSAGLSVIRVAADGSKAPVDKGWRAYSERRPTDAELVGWFQNDRAFGIGIPGGPASGNPAVLDFETWPAYERWLRLLPRHLQDLSRRCPLVQSGGGGAHLYARLAEPVPSTKLAWRPHPDGGREEDGSPKVKVLIEVKGNGGQVVAPGSPAECHPDRREYEWLRRAWVDGARYDPIGLPEWFEWTVAAESLNEIERKPDARPPDTRDRSPRAGRRPGDDFNDRGLWGETGLLEADWTWHRALEDDRGFVTRPGKDHGVSGSVGMVCSRADGHSLFYCFSSNAYPFEAGQSYSRFRVYAILKHKGDWEAAARTLGRMGYGEPSRASKGASVTFTGGSSAAPESNGGETNGAAENEQPPANPGAKPPLPITYYDDVAPVLDTADFVEGLLIDGTMTVVYGESNCGKTFFMLDLALHVAAGIPWRGLEVNKRGVLYLALEGTYGITNRVAAFKADRANVADLAFGFVPVPLNLIRDDGDTMRVIEAAKAAAARLKVPVGLIVVDTLSRAMAGGNENSPEDMTAFVEQVDLIRHALPAHLAVVHHCGKDVARGARGHSSLRAATDTEIEVSRDYASKTSIARVTKQRDLEGGAEYPFQLVPVELGQSTRRGKPVSSCVVKHLDADGRPTKEDRKAQEQHAQKLKQKAEERKQDEEDEKDVMNVISKEMKEHKTPGASRSLVQKNAECSKAEAEQAIRRLLAEGKLIEMTYTKWTGKGRKTPTPVKDGIGPPPVANEEA